MSEVNNTNNGFGFPPEVQNSLKETLKVYWRQGQGGTYPYVKGEDVIKQLNVAFGHAWSSRAVESVRIEDQVLVLVEVSATVDGTTYYHQGYGSAKIASKGGQALDIGNSYKSAFTTALKKAAEQFGVSGEEEQSETAPRQSKSVRLPYPSGKPTAPQQPAQNNRGSFTPPSAPRVPRPASSTFAPVAPKSSLAGGIPSVGGAAAPTSRPAPQKPREQRPAGLDEGLNSVELLTDAQKKAILNISAAKGYSVEEVIKEVLDKPADLDTLTLGDAILVIQHANKLTRKGA